MTACPKCGKVLFPFASGWQIDAGIACRGDCGDVQKPPPLPLPAPQPPRASKYGNQRTACCYGHTHASKKEAGHCNLLHLRVLAGEITDLECEPVYRFELNGVLIGKYRPDFRYMENGVLEVVDTKCAATKTIATNLRMKMMRAFHGIIVKEI